MIREVLTDNGVCHRAKNFAATCAELGLKHRRTRPYTPRIKGRAERIIQGALHKWAYARGYGTSAQGMGAPSSSVPSFGAKWPHGSDSARVAGTPSAPNLTS